MESVSLCPTCHISINPDYFFCPNCGRVLKAKPLSTSFFTITWLMVKTLLLPPFGLWWGYKYLRQSDSTSKIIGLIVIIVTIWETIWLTQLSLTMYQTLSSQLNTQLQTY